MTTLTITIALAPGETFASLGYTLRDELAPQLVNLYIGNRTPREVTTGTVRSYFGDRPQVGTWTITEEATTDDDADALKTSARELASHVLHPRLDSKPERMAELARIVHDATCSECDLCEACGRNMTEGEPHTADCKSAQAQDDEEGGRSCPGCGADILGNDPHAAGCPNDPVTDEDCYGYGVRARLAGINAPVLDRSFAPVMHAKYEDEGGAALTVLQRLEAWTRGWNDEHHAITDAALRASGWPDGIVRGGV